MLRSQSKSISISVVNNISFTLICHKYIIPTLSCKIKQCFNMTNKFDDHATLDLQKKKITWVAQCKYSPGIHLQTTPTHQGQQHSSKRIAILPPIALICLKPNSEYYSSYHSYTLHSYLIKTYHNFRLNHC